MFETASRLRIRFNFKGLITVEDLWDLSREDLDKIYQGLSSEQLKASQGSLLLEKKTAEFEVLELKLAIVKHIFDTKTEEANLRKLNADRFEKKRLLNEIISRKQTADLEGKSIEELQKMIEDL